jgi:hypothetical protein
MTSEPVWKPKQNLATYTRASEYNARDEQKKNEELNREKADLNPNACKYVGALALKNGFYIRKCDLEQNLTCWNFNNPDAVAICPTIIDMQKQNSTEES